MTDKILCKKTGKKIAKSDLKCPAPKGPCKYRATCLIFAFEQIEKMDKQSINEHKSNIKKRQHIDKKIKLD